jgi:hypothetical protein
LGVAQSHINSRKTNDFSVLMGSICLITLQISHFSRNHDAAVLPLWYAKKSRFSGFGWLGLGE